MNDNPMDYNSTGNSILTDNNSTGNSILTDNSSTGNSILIATNATKFLNMLMNLSVI